MKHSPQLTQGNDIASIPDHELRERLRGEVPKEAFLPNPARALLLIPQIGILVLITFAIVTLDPPWYIALLGSLLLGNFYGGMMFFGHEICHGAVVRSPWLKEVFCYVCFTIFFLSPHLWRTWHNQVHHPNANVKDRDPDNYGDMEAYKKNSKVERMFVWFGPNARHPLGSLVFFSMFFAGQAQAVLWLKSRRIPGFTNLRRSRAALDSLAMLLFWVALGILVGPFHALFVIVIPMLVANCLLLSYISTNHMISHMVESPNTMTSTLSVRSAKVVDLIHFHFSHHVEHHLFPSMPSKHYPKVRQRLRQLFGAQYLLPSHFRALFTLLKTGRVYDGPDTLVDPYTGHTVRKQDIDTVLREGGRLISEVQTIREEQESLSEPPQPTEGQTAP